MTLGSCCNSVVMGMTAKMSAGILHSVECSTYISFDTSIVTYFIELVSGDPWPHCCTDYIEHFSSKFTRFSHSILCLLIENVDMVPPCKRIPRIPVCSPYWMRNVFRHFSSRRQRIDRPQRSGKGICRIRIERAGFWINFRNNFRRNQASQRVRTLV